MGALPKPNPIIEDSPSDSVREKIQKALLGNRPPDAPLIDRQWKTFAVVERDPQKEVVGWSFVYVHPGWAYIDQLWVEESRRYQGLGRALIDKAERESVHRGCHSAYLWTQDFQAPGFYEKLGYHRFVVMENFIPGHQRIGFMKRIAE